jgi:hypothetical protein
VVIFGRWSYITTALASFRQNEILKGDAFFRACDISFRAGRTTHGSLFRSMMNIQGELGRYGFLDLFLGG